LAAGKKAGGGGGARFKVTKVLLLILLHEIFQLDYVVRTLWRRWSLSGSERSPTLAPIVYVICVVCSYLNSIPFPGTNIIYFGCSPRNIASPQPKSRPKGRRDLSNSKNDLAAGSSEIQRR